MSQKIESIIKHFLSEPVVHMEECKIGHINHTYFLTVQSGRKFVLQQINKSIFKQPDVVMNNIVAVTDFIRQRLKENGKDAERGALHAWESDQGKAYYVDEAGEYWRVYDFITDATCYQSLDNAQMFSKVGYAFGAFQRQLADFDASVLKETIPNFHNTVSRLRDFEAALAADVCHRAADVADEIRFVKEHSAYCAYIVDRIANGKLPLRVTHNDTKLNNIMIDNKTGEGICVIDLDTVMPGSVLYDFGDSIRFGASSAAEDETDLSKVYVREDMFRAFTQGFLAGLDNSLTDEEMNDLPMGALVITLETGIRFLTDYLNGDTYFRIHYPTHNLDRARNQFKLVADMEEKMDDLKKIIQDIMQEN